MVTRSRNSSRADEVAGSARFEVGARAVRGPRRWANERTRGLHLTALVLQQVDLATGRARPSPGRRRSPERRRTDPGSRERLQRLGAGADQLEQQSAELTAPPPHPRPTPPPPTLPPSGQAEKTKCWPARKKLKEQLDQARHRIGAVQAPRRLDPLPGELAYGIIPPARKSSSAEARKPRKAAGVMGDEAVTPRGHRSGWFVAVGPASRFDKDARKGEAREASYKWKGRCALRVVGPRTRRSAAVYRRRVRPGARRPAGPQPADGASFPVSRADRPSARTELTKAARRIPVRRRALQWCAIDHVRVSWKKSTRSRGLHRRPHRAYVGI